MLQKQRMEQIRQETERERSLLARQHANRLAFVGIDEGFDQGTYSNRSGEGASGHINTSNIRSPPGINTTASVSSPAQQFTMHDPLRSPDRTRPTEGVLMGELSVLQGEEVELDREVSECSARRRRCDEQRRGITLRLASLRQAEADVNERAAQLDAREVAARRRMEDERKRGRELQHDADIVTRELAERRAMVEQAERKAQARVEDDAAHLMRQQQQLRESEERLRTWELQLRLREKTLEEKEREVARIEAALHDEETREIEQLRREISFLSEHIDGSGIML